MATFRKYINELLDQKHVAALNVIKSDVTESTMCCSEMFKLWIQRQPRASCREVLNNSNKGNSHGEPGIYNVKKLLANEEAVSYRGSERL